MNRTQALAMLDLQASMNAKVNPNWLAAGYPFLRANVVEGGEAMEHHGWKWWKKQEMDKAQFAMELVDIWHFTLSAFVTASEGNINDAADDIMANLNSSYLREGLMFDGKPYDYGKMNTLDRVELLIGLSVARRVSVPLFETLMIDAGMSWDELYRQYVGKNVLNFFRQDNGYKQGTYVKVWNGKEDNEVLVGIMNELDPASPSFKDELYTRLDAAYQVILHQVAEAA